ncbi:MAG: GNAT family N-acetyltransferase [Deltaproteobacteria bacterium]|nr:GNAT family N-acetyltransferase [Deltaproteobacteria bacterium]
MITREISSPEDLKAAFIVIKELRPHLSFEEYSSIYQSARERDDYTLAGIFDQQKCIAVMGYRVLYDFAHKKHFYLDDLVVLPSHRSQGIGERLLKYAEEIARKLKCEELRLCTGTQNVRAQKLYEKCGWVAKSIAYKKKL